MKNARPMKQALSLESARARLAWLWFGGAGVVFLILVVQSLSNHYGKDSQQVWSWALPSILPTLCLIVSVMGSNAVGGIADRTPVRRNFFSISFWLSAGYLVMIVAVIAAEPLVSMSASTLYKTSSLWLAPFQGLVTSSIGFLFFARKGDHPETKSSEDQRRTTRRKSSSRL